MSPKVVFLMADYGHDPTETAIPWKVFNEAGFEIQFATENGKQPACDEMMLKGATGALLGAPKEGKEAYKSLEEFANFRNPKSWSVESFSLEEYDLVFLPGGHEKGVRQVIDSDRVHRLLAAYVPLTKKPSKKVLAAICHGVQVLAFSSFEDGTSVLSDMETTSLQRIQEEGIYQTTRLFLGDYYKTYGAGTPSVQEFITQKLKDPAQFKTSLSFSPYIVEDSKYNYLSGRFPPDAKELAKNAVSMAQDVLSPQN